MFYEYYNVLYTFLGNILPNCFMESIIHPKIGAPRKIYKIIKTNIDICFPLESSVCLKNMQTIKASITAIYINRKRV